MFEALTSPSMELVSTIPPPDGELTSLETSLAQSGLHLASVVPEPSETKHEPEQEESQAGYDPMDVNLKVILEEEHEGGKENLEAEPQEVPETESEDEKEGVPVYDYNPYYVPKDEPVEEQVEEERDEALVGKSGDIGHPIEIEVESESLVKATIQEESELDPSANESNSEWTPSRERRG